MKAIPFIFIVALLATTPATAQEDVRIGSKKFTESVILGEILTRLARAADARPVHRRELGGTRVLWEALVRGDIDAYPEYTGTITQEILAGENAGTEDEIRRALARHRIAMSPEPLGFNNTYAIGMKRSVAERLEIRTISDLARHPDLRLGFSDEFMSRADGWPALRESYNLPHGNVRGLDHDLAYRGLQSGDIDALDVYTTDAEIAYYDLYLLHDDRGHFPDYRAVVLHREDLASRFPDVVEAFARLGGKIDEQAMAAMNARVKLDGVSETEVAAAFLREQLSIPAAVQRVSWRDRLWRNTLDHLTLVAISLAAAIAISIPLGIFAARRRKTGQLILGAVGIIQTIPSLALLVFMIPLLGIGGPPAIAALFLYSLLPIVRNTYAGLHDVTPSVRESAEALGLPPLARLRLVELPIAARSILAGIKTSAVINIGTATLGALIGAGGYGQPILTGIRLDDTALILEGAVPAAVLALLVQGLFEVAERLVVAKGLRLGPPA